MRQKIVMALGWLLRLARKLISKSFYNKRDKDGAFRFKILILVVSLAPVAIGIAVYHRAMCPSVLVSGVHPGPSCLQGHVSVFIQGSLLVALVFTCGMATLQYLSYAHYQDKGLSPRSFWVVLFVVFLLAATSFDVIRGLLSSSYETILLSTIPVKWLSIIIPTPKNLLVMVVAAAFLFVDSSEDEFAEDVQTDKAVLASIILSSLLIGAAGKASLGVEFLHAFNAGSVAFHFILGTLLFQGALREPSPVPIPGLPEKEGKLGLRASQPSSAVTPGLGAAQQRRGENPI